MASNAAKLGVIIDVDDKQLTALIERIAGLTTSFQTVTNKIAAQTQAAIAKQLESVKKQVGIVAQGEKDIETIKAASVARIALLEAKITAAKQRETDKQVDSKKKQGLTEQEIAEHSAKAIGASAQKYEDLKKEYSKKSLDQIRAQIMKFEEDVRAMRQARSGEDDTDVKKSIQRQINMKNTILQQYRSLEKERIGRTFSEQLEKNFGGSTVINNIMMMKQHFTSLKQTITEPAESGGGVMGMMGGFASKAVPMVAAGAAVAGMLKGVIDIGSKYEDAMAELSAITGVHGNSLDGLGDKARELGKIYGVGAVQGVEAFKLVISALGPDIAKDQKALNEMGDDVMKLAKAAGIDAPNATSVLTTTLNQFGYGTLAPKEQAKEMTRIMNVMAAGAKEGAAEIPDLSEAMKQVGTVAKQSGLSVEQTTASIEILAMNGLKGAEAGTGLRNVLMSMSSGTRLSKDALNSLGLTFDDINPKVVGQEKGLATLSAAFERQTDPVKKAAALHHIFGKENAASANILLQNVDGLHKMTAAVTGTNEAQTQANIRMNTFSESWKRIKASAEDLAITLYNALRPVIESLMGIFQDMMPIITQLAKIIGVSLKISFEILTAPIRVIVAIVTVLWNWFSKLFTKLTESTGIAKVVSGAFDWLKKAVNDVWEWIVDKYHAAEKLLHKLSLGTLGRSQEEIDAAKNKTEPEAAEGNENGVTKVAPGELGTPGLTADEEKERKKQERLAKKEAKDAFDEAKKEEDARFEAQKVDRLKRIKENKLTDADAKIEELNDEITHNEKLRDIAERFKKDTLGFTTSIYNAQISLRKIEYDDDQEALRKNYDMREQIVYDKEADGRLTALEVKEELYKIKKEEIEAKIGLEKEYNRSTEKLQEELSKLTRKHKQEEAKELRTEDDMQLKIEQEAAKMKIDSMKDGFDKQLALLKLQHKEELDALKEKKEKEKWTEDHYNKAIELADAKSQKAIAELANKYAIEERTKKMEQLSFLTGPFVAQFGKAADKLNEKFFQPTLNKWVNQKTVVGQILGDLTTGVIKFAENWIIQKGLAVAADLLFGTTEAVSMQAIAAAAAPAAAMVSLASFGANAIPASAGITSTVGLASLLSAVKLAYGGFLPLDKGERGKDSIHAILMPGEGVLTTDEIERIGGERGFNQLRRTIRGYASGGLATNNSFQVSRDISTPDFSGNSGSISIVKELQLLNTRIDNMHETFKQRPAPQFFDGYGMDIASRKSQLQVQAAKIK